MDYTLSALTWTFLCIGIKVKAVLDGKVTQGPHTEAQWIYSDV